MVKLWKRILNRSQNLHDFPLQRGIIDLLLAEEINLKCISGDRLECVVVQYESLTSSDVVKHIGRNAGEEVTAQVNHSVSGIKGNS